MLGDLGYTTWEVWEHKGSSLVVVLQQQQRQQGLGRRPHPLSCQPWLYCCKRLALECRCDRVWVCAWTWLRECVLPFDAPLCACEGLEPLFLILFSAVKQQLSCSFVMSLST